MLCICLRRCGGYALFAAAKEPRNWLDVRITFMPHIGEMSHCATESGTLLATLPLTTLLLTTSMLHCNTLLQGTQDSIKEEVLTVLQTPDTSATPSKKRKGKGKAAAEEAQEEETAEPGITKYQCATVTVQYHDILSGSRFSTYCYSTAVLVLAYALRLNFELAVVAYTESIVTAPINTEACWSHCENSASIASLSSHAAIP
jgi:hypothetical protein